MQKQPNSRMCFVCGMENPIGLKAFFYDDDDGRVMARFTPCQEHQGYPGFTHGGIISALLDEVIGRVVTARDIWAVTAKLELKFRKPVPLEEEVTIIGEMIRLRSRSFEAKGGAAPRRRYSRRRRLRRLHPPARRRDREAKDSVGFLGSGAR